MTDKWQRPVTPAAADSPSRVGVRPSGYPNALDYAGYVAMHLACLGVFWTGVSKTDLAVFFVSYVTRMFGLVAGYHRYFSHKAFKATRGMQFVLGLLGTLSGQKGVLWWAAHHRYHHRYSDTPLDVHSPVQRSFLYSHSGWFLDEKNRDTDRARVIDLAKIPELVWLDKWNVVVVAAYAGAIYLLFGLSGLVWGYFVSTVLLWHAVHAIGSFGHRFGGYRRFATPDNSRNKWFLALVMLGEGWHNNHHYFPSSARQGAVWWEIDIAYYVLKVLSWFGLVWDLNLPAIQQGLPTGETQRHLQRFKLWLVEFRLGLNRCVDGLLSARGLTGHAALLAAEESKQKMQEHIDLFDERCTAQMLHAPESLPGTYAALERALAAEAHALAERLGLAADPAVELVRALTDDVRARVRDAIFGHLFLLSSAPRATKAMAREQALSTRP